MQTLATLSNPYHNLVRCARGLRDRQLQELPSVVRDDLKAAWQPILDTLIALQKETTRINAKARDKLCGPVLSAAEAARIGAIESWIARGCRVDEWPTVVSKVPTPREPVPGGWVDEGVTRPIKPVVARDLRRDERAL